MFKRNDDHRQREMFSTTMQLPEKRRERLERSWAGTFYRDFFCRIDESLFGCLYSDQPSRPNVPVNVLVGFEVLKAGHGWTDEQAYDEVCFNVQVRYALGLRDLTADDFSVRTVYNFRRALAEHATRTGENLFEAVFEQVTGEQQKAYEISSRELRMDSTQVASNIRRMSRLQLLLEVLQRVYRELDEGDRERLEGELGPYCKTTSWQYTRRLSTDEAWLEMQGIGVVMGWLLQDLRDRYGETDGYRVLRRAFWDHFVVVDEKVLLKSDHEISAQSMQSPDDQEATFRRKAGRSYRGYVANVTETCDEENDLQLIVDVTVEPNSVDDGQMLLDSLDELTERTEVEKLYTDGGYNGPEVDEVLARCGVEQYQSGIRGSKTQGIGRQDFDWEVDEEQEPVAVTCPQGQRVGVEKGKRNHAFVARFDERICQECELADECPARRIKRRRQRVLRINQRQLLRARRIRRSAAMRASGSNRRAAVEATVWSVKAPFPRGRVPYRGQARVTMYTIASAAMVNVRRIAAVARVDGLGGGSSLGLGLRSAFFEVVGATSAALANLIRFTRQQTPVLGHRRSGLLQRA